MPNLIKLTNIENLFRDSFTFENLTVGARLNHTDFHCSNCRECDVDIESEPIYTLYIGDEDTKIMVIGEEPSKSGINGGA